jgi:hypothetical protein
MKHIFVKTQDYQSFEKALEQIYTKNSSILILSCANSYTKEQLDPILQKYDNNILGAIFPEIIYQGRLYSQGAIFIQLDDLLNIKTINNIHDNKSINNQLKNISISNTNSIFVFADALSKKIDSLAYCLYENFGLFFNYFGAGAGNMNINNKNQYCIISNKGLCDNCAVVGFSKLKSSIGVKHGWEPINNKTLKVTKSSSNIIELLNYKDAYNEYKNLILSNYPTFQNQFNFNKITKKHPIAIKKVHNNISIIRDIVLSDKKSITSIGAIDENTTITIMQSDENKMLEATKEASIEAKEQCDFNSSLTFYFAGISRLYIFENSINNDINMILDDNKYVMGALCLGEIANIKDLLLEFHNRTSVVVKVQTNE